MVAGAAALVLLLLMAAHMALNACPSTIPRVKVTGNLGANVTLTFSFNVSINDSLLSIYRANQTKIGQCNRKKECTGKPSFHFQLENHRLHLQIINLRRKHSDTYWATCSTNVDDFKFSNKVHLTVQEEERRSSTVPPALTNSTESEFIADSIPISPPLRTALVVSPVLILAVVLPWLIWCHVQSKGKLQQNPVPKTQARAQPHAHSQEGSALPPSVPSTSLVYSVLDFPKRPSAVLEMDPSGTEYAAVSYQMEKRQV